MPDGATHHRFYKLGTVLAVPISLFTVATDIPTGIGVLAGYALGNYLDPDADIVGISASEGRAMRDWKILGYVWVGYWTVYGAVFMRMHRSFITHFPGVSTAIRLAYLLWWLPLVYWWNGLAWSDWMTMFLFGVWGGLSIADAIHWAADMFLGDTQETLIKKGRNNGRIKGSKGKQYGRKEENTRKISKRRKAETQRGRY